jgi:hypothetical protein
MGALLLLYNLKIEDTLKSLSVYFMLHILQSITILCKLVIGFTKSLKKNE